MSSFITPENKRPTNPQLVTQMNPDALEGLRKAVNDNLSSVALRYVLNILDILDAERSAAPKKAVTPPKSTKAAAEVDE